LSTGATTVKPLDIFVLPSMRVYLFKVSSPTAVEPLLLVGSAGLVNLMARIVFLETSISVEMVLRLDRIIGFAFTLSIGHEYSSKVASCWAKG